jgi:hypothetical protein
MGEYLADHMSDMQQQCGLWRKIGPTPSRQKLISDRFAAHQESRQSPASRGFTSHRTSAIASSEFRSQAWVRCQPLASLGQLLTFKSGG